MEMTGLFHSNRKVAEIEQRLDDLLVHLSSKEATQTETTDPTYAYVASALATPEETAPNFGGVIQAPQVSHFNYTTRLSPFLSFPFLTVDDFNDIISKGLVHVGYVETCQHRPALLLGIAWMATKSDRNLQRQLDREMCDMLSKTVLFNGEKKFRCNPRYPCLCYLVRYLTWIGNTNS
jgi:hypothetical protein